MKSSPAWNTNARAARARARRASHRGDVTESQLWRILNQDDQERSKESGKPLNGWSDLSDASRQDLQATLKKLEGAQQNAAAAPHAVSASEERIQQVKNAIYRCDPLHVQISKLQTAIGMAESTVKNRREQLSQSQHAVAKAQDHLCELQRRLEDVMHQRKEEEDQEYDTMDLQDGCTSWWDADSPGLDGEEIHSRK